MAQDLGGPKAPALAGRGESRFELGIGSRGHHRRITCGNGILDGRDDHRPTSVHLNPEADAPAGNSAPGDRFSIASEKHPYLLEAADEHPGGLIRNSQLESVCTCGQGLIRSDKHDCRGQRLASPPDLLLGSAGSAHCKLLSYHIQRMPI